jgi:DNA gyrase subunit B
MFANKEIVALIQAIGVGIGDQFDLNGLRYHRIVIMTDADVDGSHISTLLLTFLFRYMRDVVEGGYVYLAKPPLYSVNRG